MAFFLGSINIICIIGGIFGFIISFIGLLIQDKRDKREACIFGLVLSTIILLSLYANLYYFASITTHYKITPVVKIVEYVDNHSGIYKDTVYYYLPRFR